MIKALIFDFDGTLSNRQINAYGVFDHYLRSYFKDLDDLEYEGILQDLLTFDCNGTIPVRMRLIPFIDKYGEYLPEDFADDFTAYFYEQMYRFTVMGEDVEDTLKRLKDKYKMAILSNGNSKSQHNKIDALPLERYFDDIFVSGDYGIHKPEKQIFEMVAEQLGVRCNECMMIGDVFSSDILGAIRAGMVPVWLVTDYQRPARYYHGYRIGKLSDIFAVLEKEETHEYTGNQ